MPVAKWLRLPRQLMALVLSVTALLVVVLSVLAWRLFEQEQKLENQRVRERLDQAIDRASADLLKNLVVEAGRLDEILDLPADEIERRAARSGPASDDALLLFTARNVSSYPAHRLLYSPAPGVSPDPAPDLFAGAEGAEFRLEDHSKAIALLTPLTRSADPGIRAGALLRMARNQRKADDPEAALRTYSRLEQLALTGVNGLPAELVARHARCELLFHRNLVEVLQREVRALAAALQEGRWPISRGAYLFYMSEARRLSGAALPENPELVAFAEATADLWKQWEEIRRGEAGAQGQRSIWVDGRPVVVVWRSSPERLIARVAGTGYIGRNWLGSTNAGSQFARLGIADAEDRPIIPITVQTGGLRVTRALGIPQLRWTLQATPVNPDAEFSRLAARRNLLLAGLTFILLLAILGSYAIARVVNREMEVAQLQSDFVAAVSHEFRSPLTTMQQLSEMLASGRVPSEGRRQHYYDVMARETSRLHHLVEDLLDFGRMEAGAHTYRLQTLESRELIARAVSDFQVQAESGGYTVTLDAGDVSALVDADPQALRRAFWNLLDNAVKYSPDCKTIHVEMRRENHRLAVAVRDHGMGIALEDQQRIFRKFIRGVAAKEASIRGTGLGLAMVRHIVDAHRGEVRLESEPGRGSTFTIVLPIAADGLPPAQAEPAQPKSEST